MKYIRRVLSPKTFDTRWVMYKTPLEMFTESASIETLQELIYVSALLSIPPTAVLERGYFLQAPSGQTEAHSHAGAYLARVVPPHSDTASGRFQAYTLAAATFCLAPPARSICVGVAILLVKQLRKAKRGISASMTEEDRIAFTSAVDGIVDVTLGRPLREGNVVVLQEYLDKKSGKGLTK